jgi:hypothetical protein
MQAFAFVLQHVLGVAMQQSQQSFQKLMDCPLLGGQWLSWEHGTEKDSPLDQWLFETLRDSV